MYNQHSNGASIVADNLGAGTSRISLGYGGMSFCANDAAAAALPTASLDHYSLFVTTTWDADATNHGAFVVSGGVGIAKNVYVGGNCVITGTTACTSESTGALVVKGGCGISGDMAVKGGIMAEYSEMTTFVTSICTVVSTLQATATYGGALAVGGGVGIEKNAYIGGNCVITGTITKGGGSFLIPHPDPSKTNWKLKHCFVESDTRGTNIYEYQISTTNCAYTIALPSYFKYLNERPRVYVSAVDVLGYGMGDVNIEKSEVSINVSKDGRYNVMITGVRMDKLMKDYWDEYGAEIPPS